MSDTGLEIVEQPVALSPAASSIDPGSKYKIRISASDVPETLLGMPLPIEISRLNKDAFNLEATPAYQRNPRASARVWAVLTLENGAAVEANLECPGRFILRAELPSGFRIAETVDVNAEADQNGLHAIVTLDISMAAPPGLENAGPSAPKPLLSGIKPEHLQAMAPVARPARSIDREGSDDPGPSAAAGARESDLALGAPSRGGGLDSFSDESDVADRTFVIDGMRAEGSEAAPAERDIFDRAFRATSSQTRSQALKVQYGLFRRWSRDADGVLEARWRGDAGADLPGLLNLDRHPGVEGKIPQWRPVLVEIERKAGQGARSTSIVVWPPSAGNHPLSLMQDPAGNPNASAPDLLATTDNDDRMADVLFSYIRTGALDTARHAMPALIAQARELLSAKGQNPILATPAAYTLLKLGNMEFVDWIGTLANNYPRLPDGAIVYAWCLIRAGKAELAAPYFHEALDRGLPMYSAGVRLLRDGLTFLHGLNPQDELVARDAVLAHQIANGANLQSELTCVTLGRGLDLLFT